MKNRLLQAMKSLPMLAEDKEKFVDIIISKSNSGGGSKLGYLYFKNTEVDGIGFLSAVLTDLYNEVPISIIFKDNGNNVLTQNIAQVSGLSENSSIAIGDFIAVGAYIAPFYFFLATVKGEEFVNAFKANEITEEEFFEGNVFGIPEI